MCSDPQTVDGNTFACRKCNECIAARKNEWVARAMAEKATSQHALIVNLTYRNEAGGVPPDGALAFEYSHVQNFMRALRQAFFRRYKRFGDIRFLVAGERGSRRNRVHWHLILFADECIEGLGEFFEPNTNRPVWGMTFDERILWSFWPHGHVWFQLPDVGGMQYVLKYVLKEQFQPNKAKGTRREGKMTERHGASFFMQSRKPAIGSRWIAQKLARLNARDAVLPSPELGGIPDYQGYWWPTGRNRLQLLHGLHAINARVRQERGVDCPQWSTLLESVTDCTKDEEALLYGAQKGLGKYEGASGTGAEGGSLSEAERATWSLHLHGRGSQGATGAQGRCTGPRVCGYCYRSKTAQERREAAAYYSRVRALYDARDPSETGVPFDYWHQKNYGANPHCDPSARRA